MDITAEHLDAIRLVLNQEVTRKQVATDYSPLLKTMVGITILQGVDVQDDDLIMPRGIYGELLHGLTVAPGVPAEGWPKNKSCATRPAWHKEASSHNLVGRSRRYGFHKTKNRRGHGVIFVGHPAFEALLREDKSFAEVCRTWYNEVRQVILERDAEQAAQRKIRQLKKARERQRERRQRPKLRKEFAEVVEWWDRIIAHPHDATYSGIKGLTLELQDLLKRYNPEG